MVWPCALSFVSKYAQKSNLSSIRKFTRTSVSSTSPEVRVPTPELSSSVSVSVIVPQKSHSAEKVSLAEKLYLQKGPPTLLKTESPTNLAVTQDAHTGVTNDHDKRELIRDWIPSPLFHSESLVNWPMLRLEETVCEVIDTEEKFKGMMSELRELQVLEIAFDVKHSYSSYHRLTCLISISTRFKDYIVDCLSLQGSVKELAEIFENPYVLKVTFCERMVDVQCLEKDFGIYVIGLFDAWKAERKIGSQCQMRSPEWNGELRPCSYLLSKYLNVENIHHGVWKRRPLNEPAVNAARCESHYLLHLYKEQKRLLLALGNGHLVDAYELSKSVQIRDLSSRNGKEWMHKYRDEFSNQQWFALTELNDWRRRVAKGKNCNVHFVATNKALIQLAATLPTTEDHLLEIVSTRLSPTSVTYLKNDVGVLLEIFRRSLELE